MSMGPKWASSAHDAVECEYGDAVSGAYAKGLQSGCQAMGALAELAVRETAFAIDNGDPVAVDVALRARKSSGVSGETMGRR